MPSRKPKEEMPAKVREQLENLKFWHPQRRADAAAMLGQIGGAEVVPALAERLRDKHSNVRWHAAQALGNIGHVSGDVPLAKALQDEEPNVRKRAAVSLGMIGRAIQGKKVEGKEAKALQMVAEHFHEREEPAIIQKVLQAALKGKITKENARLYVKQLRALQGSVK